ncbi:MAG: hypothetical protein HOH74_11265, partial [Gemmatimonadetes bacterium]|nr:hypothetical protein [Gemmatimonadota bacterium]
MRTENQAEPRIHCIIPDAQQQHLLLVEGAAGLEVPTVPRTRPGWFATEVGQINQAVAVQFGLDATVLRDLGQDGGGAWCELEMHGGHQTRGCWVSIGDLADLVLAHGERS